MRRFDVGQGSYGWLLARLGIPTASQFHRIITPKTRQPSAQGKAYVYELLAEWLLGEPIEHKGSGFMARGKELESDAVRRIEWDRDCTVDRVGFCLTDDGRVGCSPDGLIGDDEGLEIKVLSAANHVGAMLSPPDDKHICQIQGGMYVTGRSIWTRMYYHPSLPPVYHRIERDDTFIAALDEALEAFQEMLSAGRQWLLKAGCKPREPRNAQEANAA